MNSGAAISRCGRYRYSLWRYWEPGGSICLFIGLNPSTADATTDDPTIRRCVDFARRWDYGGMTMANLFALRSTDPAQLRTALNPIGPLNDDHLRQLIWYADTVVVAWGARPEAASRRERIFTLDTSIDLYCLGTTKHGHPKHPLYLKKDTELEIFRESEASDE